MLSFGRMRKGLYPHKTPPLPPSPSSAPQQPAATQPVSAQKNGPIVHIVRHVLANPLLEPIYFGEDPQIADWYLAGTLVCLGVIVHRDVTISFAPIPIPKKSQVRVEIEWQGFEPRVEAGFALRYLLGDDRTARDGPVLHGGGTMRALANFTVPAAHLRRLQTFACALEIGCISKKPVLIRRAQAFIEETR